MTGQKALSVLLLLGLTLGVANAAISCWSCDSNTANRDDLDCHDPESGYYGRVEQCKGATHDNEWICLKKIGTPEQLGLNSDLADAVIRGCVPDDEDSPWEDGAWKEKNRCKEDAKGAKICTCKDGHMCNGVESVGTSGKVAVMMAVALVSMRMA